MLKLKAFIIFLILQTYVHGMIMATVSRFLGEKDYQWITCQRKLLNLMPRYGCGI